MLTRIATVISQLGQGAASVAGLRIGTEEPRYLIQATVGDVQIRRYGKRIAAQTTVGGPEKSARSEGFHRLARYIFGGNQSRATIAMTAPVAQHRTGADGQKIAMTAPVSQAADATGKWVVRFFMPARCTLQALPIPDDAAVSLVTVPAETVAVLRFRGAPSPHAVATKTAEVMDTLRTSDFTPAGAPAAWFYDPPWTVPLLRRNEVGVPVKKRDPR